MAEQEPSKNQQLYLLAIAGVVIVILIAVWLLFAKEKPTEPPVNLMPPVVNEPVQQEPESVIEDTAPQPEPEADTTPEPELAAEPTEPVAAEPAIPTLDESDTEVRQRLLALDWKPGLASLFVTDEMLRNFTVQVDNIAQGQLATGHALLQPLEQKFAIEEGGALQLDEASFKRYQPYIQLLESVKPAQLITLFNRYEPLLQQAYADLGYPDQLFKNKLLEAIDVLLATPEVEYPLALERPAVVYVFADPAIEQLPPAQKQMIRLGPGNQQRVKALLRQYQQQLQ